MDELKKSVLVPTIFFSWFKFPLTIKELRRYLWQQELSVDELKKILRLLPGIRWENDLVWYGDVVSARQTNQHLADQFWRKVKRWRWLFSNIPFLREVFIGNTLAYDNVHHGSDIDLFIVGQTGRLWTCRAVLLVVMNWLGLRVRGQNRHAKFSPEFWVGDSMLNLRSIAIDRDYYLSFWLADVVNVWPGGEQKRLWQANPWLKDDLPIAWRSQRVKEWPLLRSSLAAKLIERVLRGKWGDALERRLRSAQRRIIKRNLARLATHPSVLVEDNVIKLHFNDRRSAVRDAIEKALSELLAEA